MTDATVDAIRQRLANATPPPWQAITLYPDRAEVHGEERLAEMYGTNRRADAELIAHAPSDLAHLLERVDQLQQAGNALADALRMWEPVCGPANVVDADTALCDALAQWDAAQHGGDK